MKVSRFNFQMIISKMIRHVLSDQIRRQKQDPELDQGDHYQDIK